MCGIRIDDDAATERHHGRATADHEPIACSGHHWRVEYYASWLRFTRRERPTWGHNSRADLAGTEVESHRGAGGQRRHRAGDECDVRTKDTGCVPAVVRDEYRSAREGVVVDA